MCRGYGKPCRVSLRVDWGPTIHAARPHVGKHFDFSLRRSPGGMAFADPSTSSGSGSAWGSRTFGRFSKCRKTSKLMVLSTVKAILFDLDETLILERPIAHRALEHAAQRAHAVANVPPSQLRDAVLKRAGELWRSTPVIDYCRRVGISSWEGLWCEFAGENENLVWIREWSPTYRFEP